MGLNGQLACGEVFANLPKPAEVVSVDGQLVDGNIIGCFGRMCPAKDGIGSSVEDVLGVGTGKIGGEGNIEGMVDDRVADLRRGYGRWTDGLGRELVRVLMRMEALHRHCTQVGPRGHAKGGTHAL